MGTNEEDKSELEILVFNSFVKASRLPIILDSVEKTKPPAPDILCEHETEGKIAFELAQLIDEDNAKKNEYQKKIQDLLDDEYEKISLELKIELDQRLNNAQIYFSFVEPLSKNKLKNRTDDIFEELRRIEPDFEGEIKRFENNQVKNIVKAISISRGNFNGPIFSAECFSGPGKPVVKILEEKLKKKYKSKFPIEFIGFFTFSGSMPKQMWIKETADFFDESKKLGPFRKIWLYDFYKQSIEFEYP